MFRIDTNGNILVNRGDTFITPLFLDKSKSFTEIKRFRLRAGDILFFGVMEANVPFEEGLIRKAYAVADENSFGDIVVTFNSDDTRELLPGTYFYEAKLYRPAIESGDQDIVITVVPRRKFIIME